MMVDEKAGERENAIDGARGCTSSVILILMANKVAIAVATGTAMARWERSVIKLRLLGTVSPKFWLDPSVPSGHRQKSELEVRLRLRRQPPGQNQNWKAAAESWHFNSRRESLHQTSIGGRTTYKTKASSSFYPRSHSNPNSHPHKTRVSLI